MKIDITDNYIVFVGYNQALWQSSRRRTFDDVGDGLCCVYYLRPVVLFWDYRHHNLRTATMAIRRAQYLLQVADHCQIRQQNDGVSGKQSTSWRPANVTYKMALSSGACSRLESPTTRATLGSHRTRQDHLSQWRTLPANATRKGEPLGVTTLFRLPTFQL